jgi:hypothetical protein
MFENLVRSACTTNIYLFIPPFVFFFSICGMFQVPRVKRGICVCLFTMTVTVIRVDYFYDRGLNQLSNKNYYLCFFTYTSRLKMCIFSQVLFLLFIGEKHKLHIQTWINNNQREREGERKNISNISYYQ